MVVVHFKVFIDASFYNYYEFTQYLDVHQSNTEVFLFLHILKRELNKKEK